jgi:hypothetical protein
MGDQLPQSLAMLVDFKIENNAVFVRVIGGERKTLLGIEMLVFKRTLVAHDVTARCFDKNHLGAEIGKEQTAIAAHSTRQVQYAQAG